MAHSHVDRVTAALATTLLVLVSATQCGGQITRSMNSEDPTSPHIIEVRGIVTDTSGHPVADADLVWIEWQRTGQQLDSLGRPYLERETVRSASDGTFLFSNIDLARLRENAVFGVRAVARGRAYAYQSGRVDRSNPRSPRIVFGNVNRASSAEPWMILSEGTTARGVVVDVDNKPVVSALVGAEHGRPAVRTDEQGRFELAHFPVFADSNIDPTARCLRVSHPDFVERWFYDGQVPGETFRLQVQRGVLIQGRVTESTSGQPCPGAMVNASTTGAGFLRPYTRTEEDGTYRIRAVAGDVMVNVIPAQRMREAALQFDGRSWIATEPMIRFAGRDGEQRAGVDFQLRRSLKVSGVVCMPNEELPPIPLDVDVYWTAADGNRSTHLERVAPDRATGSFELSKLAAGRYLAIVTTRDSRHARLGESSFEVIEWEDFHGVEIVLPDTPELMESVEASIKLAEAEAARPRPATQPMLRGRVTDSAGVPICLARVVMLTDPDQAGPADPARRSCFTERDGQFELASSRQISQRLTAWVVDERGGRAGWLALEPDWHLAAHDMQLSTDDSRLSGTVRNVAGKPLSGVPVSLRHVREFSGSTGLRTSEGTELLSAVTDEDGRYDLRGLRTIPEGVSLRLTTLRRPAVLYGVGAGRSRGINDNAHYNKFPLNEQGQLNGLDFVYDERSDGTVAQSVVLKELSSEAD